MELNELPLPVLDLFICLLPNGPLPCEFRCAASLWTLLMARRRSIWWHWCSKGVAIVLQCCSALLLQDSSNIDLSLYWFILLTKYKPCTSHVNFHSLALFTIFNVFFFFFFLPFPLPLAFHFFFSLEISRFVVFQCGKLLPYRVFTFFFFFPSLLFCPFSVVDFSTFSHRWGKWERHNFWLSRVH